MLKVGDVVYLKEHSSKSELESATVIKMGRQYAHLSNRTKIDLSTNCLVSNYGYSIYFNKEDYEQEVKKRKYWQLIIRELTGVFSCPEHLTIENLKAILDILNGNT